MGNGLTNVVIIVPISTEGEDAFESSYPRLPVVRIVRLTTQTKRIRLCIFNLRASSRGSGFDTLMPDFYNAKKKTLF